MSDALLARIAAAENLHDLDAVRVSLLGKSGEITAKLKSLGSMDADTRAAEAPKIHALREQVTTAIADRKAALENAELERKLATEKVDLSLPAPEIVSGTVHPVSQVMDELAEIFADLGFSVAEGPEIETQWYNFTALNMPEFHPARAMADTFYLEPRTPDEEPRVLRTHLAIGMVRSDVTISSDTVSSTSMSLARCASCSSVMVTSRRSTMIVGRSISSGIGVRAGGA